MKIRTDFDYLPIPIRDMDWQAVRDGDEEFGPSGHGATEAEAIADLQAQLAEAED